MIVVDEPDASLLSVLNDAVPQAEKNFGDDVITVHISTVELDRVNLAASFEKG